MHWKRNLAKSFVQYSLALAVVCCAYAQSFGGIIVTTVLRSQTNNGSGGASVVVDVFGQGTPAAESIGAFGLSVAVAGPGTITGFAVSAPALPPSEPNSGTAIAFRALTPDGGANGGSFTGTTANFRRAGLPFNGEGLNNVVISSAALSAGDLSSPTTSNRWLGSISFTTSANGVFTFTPANTTFALPATTSGTNSGFVTNSNGVFSATSGNNFTPSGINITAVPEPSSIALLAVAGIGLGYARRRMKKNVA